MRPNFATSRALAAAHRADRPAQPQPRKARRRPAAPREPARPPIEDDDDDVPLFASRKVSSPGVEAGPGEGAGTRGQLPAVDPSLRAGVAEGSQGEGGAHLDTDDLPASPKTPGSDSGPIRRPRRAGRRRVVRSTSESSDDEGRWDARKPRPTGHGAGQLQIHLDISSDSDDPASADGLSCRTSRERRPCPRQSGAARKQGARDSPTAMARDVVQNAAGLLEADAQGLSDDDEAEESESASLAGIQMEIVREYEKLKGDRPMSKADFRDISVKRLGFYRWLFRRFLANRRCRRLDLRVRRPRSKRFFAFLVQFILLGYLLHRRGRCWETEDASWWPRS